MQNFDNPQMTGSAPWQLKLTSTVSFSSDDAPNARIVSYNYSDRMHGMIQTEARLIIYLVITFPWSLTSECEMCPVGFLCALHGQRWYF